MHYKEYENLQILTEEGDKDILEYINLKRLNKKQGTELEIYGTENLYNINVVSYRANKDNFFNIIDLSFLFNYMKDMILKNDLCILLNDNYNHWTLVL